MLGVGSSHWGQKKRSASVATIDQMIAEANAPNQTLTQHDYYSPRPEPGPPRQIIRGY